MNELRTGHGTFRGAPWLATLVVGLTLLTPALAAASSESAPTTALERAEAARRVMAQDPADAQAALQLGVALSELGARDPALAAFDEARRRAPNLLEAYLLPSLLMRDAGRTRQALELVESGLLLLRSSVDLWVQSASLRLELGLPGEALIAVQTALEELGETPALAQVRGLALAELPDRRGEARAVLESSLDVGGESVPSAVWSMLGDLAMEDGDSAAAVRHLEAGVKAHPDDPALWFRLGTALRVLGRGDDADGATSYAAALRAKDEQAKGSARALGTKLNEAQELAQQGKLDEALRAADEATDLAPSSGQAWALRAKVLFSAGTLEDAIRAIEKAREVEPSAVEYHYLAGAFLRSVGRFDEARAALSSALAILPILGEAHALLGAIAMEEKQFEAAAGHLQDALDTGLSTGDLHAAYAQVLTQLGRGAESAEQWRLSREARARGGQG